jgi:hypothetical protein
MNNLSDGPDGTFAKCRYIKRARPDGSPHRAQYWGQQVAVDALITLPRRVQLPLAPIIDS